MCSPVLNQFKCSLKETANSNSPVPQSVNSANQDDAEILVKTLLTFFSKFPDDNASVQCKEAAYPFTCQYFLPPCSVLNGTAQTLYPSMDQCRTVLALCSEQLKALVADQPDVGSLLPDCQLLPNRSDHDIATCESKLPLFIWLRIHNWRPRYLYVPIITTLVLQLLNEFRYRI